METFGAHIFFPFFKNTDLVPYFLHELRTLLYSTESKNMELQNITCEIGTLLYVWGSVRGDLENQEEKAKSVIVRLWKVLSDCDQLLDISEITQLLIQSLAEEVAEESDDPETFFPTEEETKVERAKAAQLLQQVSSNRTTPSSLPFITAPKKCIDPMQYEESDIKWTPDTVLQISKDAIYSSTVEQLVRHQLADPTKVYYNIVKGQRTDDPRIVRVMSSYPMYVEWDNLLTVLEQGAQILKFTETERQYDETISESVVLQIQGAAVGGTHGGPGTSKRIHAVSGFIPRSQG